MRDNDTQTLIERARRGESDARDKLVARHGRRLEARIRARVSDRLASRVEDIAQDTWVEALRSLARFRWRGERSFRAWLDAIAENIVRKAARRDAVRDAARDRVRERVRLGRGEDEVSAGRRLRREERLERLEGALRGLPPDYRDVLILSRIDGLKIREMAERLGRSESAVKNLLHRALAALRERFGDTASLGLPDRGLRVERESPPQPPGPSAEESP